MRGVTGGFAPLSAWSGAGEPPEAPVAIRPPHYWLTVSYRSRSLSNERKQTRRVHGTHCRRHNAVNPRHSVMAAAAGASSARELDKEIERLKAEGKDTRTHPAERQH